MPRNREKPARSAGASAGLVVGCLLAVALTVGPASIQAPDAAHPAPGASSDETGSRRPPAGKTLVPVTDPRCSLVMPPFQTYKEVPVDTANQPPRCDEPGR
ncbi:hypothetical protein [uncultured Alsobacter sp.]|uniref:hypothetical protein n=1 Tax=uncultured Alsobacter sp. TaxID=1748258 RepID=UPI0025E73DE9|nr:hypothetical protein [uncultured Alsobacter sp.]